MANVSTSTFCRSMQCVRTFIVCAIIALAPSLCQAQSQVSVPITVQESLYTGVSGVGRSQEPVTVGIPLPDSYGIKNTSQLGVAGTTAGQLRVLARWPSGNIKWVLVDALVDVNAGQQSTALTLTSGSGNTGGANLAIDNGTSITVDTGSAQFTVRKANYNVFDKVVINGKTVLDSTVKGNDGLVVTGPASGTSCSGSCTTDYKSINDNTSTCSIEENGPVRAALKCTGGYVNGSVTYMRWTVRMQFYKSKSYAKLNVSLRNADDTSADNTFQSANKGMTANELRLSPILSSGKGFAFGNHTGTPTSAQFSGTENAYQYQAYSTNLVDTELPGGYLKVSSGSYAQNGYQITQGSTNLQTGSKSQYPEGWGDVYDSAGTGIEVGVYQASAFWPKSIQFQGGGAEVRIGIWPDQKLYTMTCGGTSPCAVPYYMPWPQHSIHDVFINFHEQGLTNSQRSATFKDFQYPLVGRAPYDWYNKADVFNYKIPNPSDEDSFYKQQALAVGEPNSGSYTYSDIVPSTWRFHGWHDTGGLNQHDFRLADLIDFLQRGSTGRYLNAMHFYRYVSELGMPRADGFHWNKHAASDGRVDALGFPQFSSQNTPSVERNWLDQEHAHVYGIFDYYFMTGDETIHDFLLDGPVTRWMNPNVYLAAQFNSADSKNGGGCVEAFSGNWGCGIWNERALGEALHGGAKMWEFLKSTGDMSSDVDRDCSSYPEVCGPLSLANYITKGMVLQDLKANGYGVRQSAGTSPILGVQHLGPQAGCGSYRNLSPFFEGILLNGVYAVVRANGPSWQYYWPLMDKLYGIAQWGANTGWNASANENWYNMYLDVANNNCTSEGYVLQNNVELATFWTMQHEYAGGTNWQTGFANMVKGQFGWSMYDDLWSYTLKDGVYRMKNPSSRPALVNVPLTSFSDNGGGSYTLTWSQPSNVAQYRLKYAQGKQIVDWVRYNPSTNTFTDNPSTQWPWFSATDVTAPAANANSITVTGLPSGLTANNMQLRAYVQQSGTGSGDTTAPSVAVATPVAGTTVSGVVSITASASDNVAVAAVWFAVDGTPIGSQIVTSPYTVTWDTTSAVNGTHTITATASDTTGNTKVATSTVTVNNSDRTAPTIAISSPTNGAAVSGAVAITAAASDNVGITSVTFAVDGSTIATDTASPYTATWNVSGVANGTHTISAVARDAAGNSSAASATVTVNNADKTAPTVTISSPTSGATVSGAVAITAAASDNVGIVSVSFTVDGAAIGTATAAPYSVSWGSASVANGTHTISAIAKDAAGNSATSSATVTVSNSDRTVPTIAITSPSNGSSLSGSITLTATASDNVGIVSVSFTVDGTPVGSDTSAPYSVVWNSSSVANGTHIIAASANDAAGNSSTQSVSVTVSNSDKTAPTVAITSPTNGSTISGPVTLIASASDDVGVASVAFTVDGTLIGSASAAPYAVNWNLTGVATGVHAIVAVATDGAGNRASSQISVTVQKLVTDDSDAFILSPDTQFTVQEDDLNIVVACPKCYFQSATDLMPGQSMDVWVDSKGSQVATVVNLKQGTIDGSIQSVGTNQFTIKPKSPMMPSAITVLTGNVTVFRAFSSTGLKVGQNVAIRGLLLKNSPTGGPTIVAKQVELRP